MPVRDFDAERSEKLLHADTASFTLGGHLFTCRRKISPDVLKSFQALQQTTAAEDGDAVATLDGIMLDLIRPQDHAMWTEARAVREPEERVIDLFDCMNVIEWVLETVLKAPLESASASTTPPGDTPPGQSPSNGTPPTSPDISTPAASSTEPVASTT